MKENNSFKNLLFTNFNNFLAFTFLVLFGIVIISVLIMSFFGKLDFISGLEKTFLAFEGIIGAIIGFYFGYRGIERAEKERDEAVSEKMSAIEKKQKAISVRDEILEKAGLEGKRKEFIENFFKEYHPENLDKFMEKYRKWMESQSTEGAIGLEDPGVTP